MSGRIVEGRMTRRSRNVYGIGPDVDDRAESLHIPDFLAFVAFGFPSVALPRIGVPLNEAAPAVLVAMALFRLPQARRRVPAWLIGALLGILALLAAVSYAHDLTPFRRLLHVALYIALVVVIATGRVHLLSAAKGLAVGLFATTLISTAVLVRSGQPRLIATLGDPNAGGFILVVLGAVTLGSLPRGRARTALMVVLGTGIVLTYSRTALLAAALAVVWVAVARRLNIWGQGVLVVGAIYGIAHIPREVRLFGPFSDRTGSDSLRARITAQEKLDVAASPWVGNGAGTATVRLGDDQFFYHSSYLGVQREGGLVLLALLVGIGAVTVIRMATMPAADRNMWWEAALIAVAVVALNLGEVLLDLSAAVALGAAVHHRLTVDPRAGPRTDVVRLRPAHRVR